jgi:hypothetical protein
MTTHRQDELNILGNKTFVAAEAQFNRGLV